MLIAFFVVFIAGKTLYQIGNLFAIAVWNLTKFLLKLTIKHCKKLLSIL